MTNEKMNSKAKKAMVKEMPEDFQFLYEYAKENMGIDLWDALEE